MPDPHRSLPPQVGHGDAWEMVTTTFACDQCGANASTLALLPPFGLLPWAQPPDLPDENVLFADSLRFSIDGPVNVTHLFPPEREVDLAALDAALRAGDARALYRINPEFAPAWCWSCSKSYCRACWVMWVDYDDGFYDCTRGRCPEGHERVIDD